MRKLRQEQWKRQKVEDVMWREPPHVDSRSPCWSQGRQLKKKPVALMLVEADDDASKAIWHKDFAWLQYFPLLSKAQYSQSPVFSTWSFFKYREEILFENS